MFNSRQHTSIFTGLQPGWLKNLAGRSTIYRRHEARSNRSLVLSHDDRPKAVRVLSRLPGFCLIFPPFEKFLLQRRTKRFATRSTIYKRHKARSERSLALSNDNRPKVVRILSRLPGFCLLFPPYEKFLMQEAKELTWNNTASYSKEEQNLSSTLFACCEKSEELVDVSVINHVKSSRPK